MRRKIIIIGGGFGGLTVAKSLKNSKHDILLIDKTNHHLFQPLLYQVATAALSPADIAAPIREILNKQKNVKVIMGEVTDINLDLKKVYMSNLTFDYDYLIIAVGSRHSYFGNDEWEKYAPGLKTINDALYIREKMLLSFEKAELLSDKKEIEKLLTFVIVGGGPTGVELAGAISEIAKRTMLKDFRNINPANTKIILVEASDRILPAFDPDLSMKAKHSLEKLGVKILLDSKVKLINEHGVQINSDFIETYNVLWAAGNKVQPLVEKLNHAFKADRVQKDKSGRVIVEKDCSIKNYPDVFVIGDAALFIDNGRPLPGIAPVAIQQGKYVANIIKKNISKEQREPFKYFDKGIMATVGKVRAVAQIWKIKVNGLLAWLIWSFVHILYLIGFRNRYRVMAEWIWLYITNRNGIRLITHPHYFGKHD